MLRETTKKAIRKTTRVKHRGITDAAKVLGVHRIHLWLVLEGKRKSRSLMDRYNRLTKADQQKGNQ